MGANDLDLSNMRVIECTNGPILENIAEENGNVWQQIDLKKDQISTPLFGSRINDKACNFDAIK